MSAVLLAGMAVRHVVLALAEQRDAILRHWVFVPINVGVAALLVWRPRWAFYPLVALSIQQVWSHGRDLSQSFIGPLPLDKFSVAVFLFFPTLVTILYLERQE